MSLAISLLKRICRCQKKSSFLLAQKRELSLSHFCRQSDEQDFVDLTVNSQSGEYIAVRTAALISEVFCIMKGGEGVQIVI